ncbi:calcium-binding protein [Burkholderia gladioli]|uniref:beta strand repeat-containing protein n=1 Tax=Burkholderia gladioli TaxID=28095 RepID=UPI0030D4C7FB
MKGGVMAINLPNRVGLNFDVTLDLFLGIYADGLTPSVLRYFSDANLFGTLNTSRAAPRSTYIALLAASWDNMWCQYNSSYDYTSFVQYFSSDINLNRLVRLLTYFSPQEVFGGSINNSFLDTPSLSGHQSSPTVTGIISPEYYIGLPNSFFSIDWTTPNARLLMNAFTYIFEKVNELGALPAHRTVLLQDGHFLPNPNGLLTYGQIAAMSPNIFYSMLVACNYDPANVTTGMGPNHYLVNLLNGVAAQNGTALFQWIPNQYLFSLSSAQLQSLAPAVMSGLTASQFESLSISQFQALTPTQVSYVTPATIASLGTYIANLTPEQLNGLIPAQVASLSAAQIASFTVAPLQIILNGSAASLSIAAIKVLTPIQISQIPPQILQNFSDAQLAALSSSQIAALTPAQVWSLPSGQLKSLNSFSSLSPIVITGFSAAQIANFNVQFSEVAARNPTVPLLMMTASSQVANIPASVVAQLLPGVLASASKQLAWLTRGQALNLTVDQVSALSSLQLNSLITTPLVLSNASSISQLSSTDIAQLLPSTVAALTSGQFSAFSVAQIQQLSNSQVAALSVQVLDSFTPATWAKFTTSQLQAISPATLAQTNSYEQHLLSTIGLSSAQNQALLADPLTMPKVSAATAIARTDYVASNTARSILGSASTLVASAQAAAEESQLNALAAYYKNLRTTINSTRQADQGGRLVGSILAVGGAGNAFINAYMSSSGQSIASSVLQGVTYIASLLQVPYTLAFAAYRDWLKTYNSSYNTAYAAALSNISNPTLAQINTAQETARVTALQTAQQLIKTNSLTNTLSQPVANIFADITPDPVTKASPLNTVQLVTAIANSTKPLAGQVAGINVSYLVKNAPSLTQLSPLGLFSDRAIEELKAGASFQIANFLSVANNIYASVTAPNPVAEGLDIFNTIASALVLVGDALPVFFETGTANASQLAGSFAASSFLGVGTLLGVLGSDALNAYSAAKAYQANPTTGNLISEVGGDVSMGLQLGLIAGSIALSGIAGAAAAALIVFIPNFSAIGAAVDLKNQRDTLDSEGRTIEGDVIAKALYNIACLNATPLINLTSFIYTPVMTNALYSKMSSNNGALMIQAAGQDLAWQMKGVSSGESFISYCQNIITKSQSQNGNQISEMLYLQASVLSNASYYGEKAGGTDTTNYVSLIDVTAAAEQVNTQGASSVVILGNYNNGAVGSEYVSITRAVGATQALAVDASSASKSMIFSIAANNVTVKGGSAANTFLVNLDQVTGPYSIVGGSSGQDQVDFLADSSLRGQPTINLDYIVNVAKVVGAGPVPGYFAGNTVTGTRSGQNYVFNRSVDQVTMTGGSDTVVIGGNGSSVKFANGNNTLYSALGIYNNPTLGAAVYDGGSAVVNAPNVLNFSGSVGSLQFALNDSAQWSSVSTLYGAGDPQGFADGASFRNFQTVYGSNYGDYFNVNNLSSPEAVSLGIGNNTVSVSNTSNLDLRSGPGADLIELNSGSNIAINSVGSGSIYENQIQNLQVMLNGASDSVTATGGNGGVLGVIAGSGNHSVILEGGIAQIAIDPVSANNTVDIHDAASRASNVLDLVLGADLSHEFLSWNGSSLTAISADGTNQVLNYTADIGPAQGTTALAAVDVTAESAALSLHTVSMSASLLIQAMSQMSSGSTTMNINGNQYAGYMMSTLFSYVSSHNSATVG